MNYSDINTHLSIGDQHTLLVFGSPDLAFQIGGIVLLVNNQYALVRLNKVYYHRQGNIEIDNRADPEDDDSDCPVNFGAHLEILFGAQSCIIHVNKDLPSLPEDLELVKSINDRKLFLQHSDD